MAEPITDERIESVAAAWLAAWNAQPGSDVEERNQWANHQVSNWTWEDEHEALWKFILSVYGGELSNRAIGELAAGPIENLLSYFGARYVDRVETLARQDPKFNFILGGVWQHNTSDEIWKRIVKIRNKSW